MKKKKKGPQLSGPELLAKATTPPTTTVAEVARWTGRSRSLVHFWINGERVPSEPDQDVLQKRLGIPKVSWPTRKP